MLASSLQTAYNLRTLPNLVARLVNDLGEAVEDRIRNVFDLSSISKEVVAKGIVFIFSLFCILISRLCTQILSSHHRVCSISRGCAQSPRASLHLSFLPRYG